MAFRADPYSAFNFVVQIGNSSEGGAGDVAAGFSDFSAPGNEVTYAEYRNGNDPQNHVRKVAMMNKTDDVTLKRGLVGDLRLFAWLKRTREGAHEPLTLTVTLLDESGRQPVCSWVLDRAQPKKWTGPALAAKGGSDVAMEELSLVAESIEFNSL